MSVEFKGFTVSFEEDLSEDVVEELRKAILLLKGVVDVRPEPVDSSDHINRMQIRTEVAQRLYKALYEES